MRNILLFALVAMFAFAGCNQPKPVKTIENLKIQLDKYFIHISFYRENALHKADLLIQTANQQFQKKEIEYIAYFEALESALKIQLDYLEKVKLYNQTAIELESYID